jgi:hypothetical protein
LACGACVWILQVEGTVAFIGGTTTPVFSRKADLTDDDKSFS